MKKAPRVTNSPSQIERTVTSMLGGVEAPTWLTDEQFQDPAMQPVRAAERNFALATHAERSGKGTTAVAERAAEQLSVAYGEANMGGGRPGKLVAELRVTLVEKLSQAMSVSASVPR